MKLTQAFDQIDISLEEAQAFLTTLVYNTRDRYPETYASVMQQIADMKDLGPPSDASSSSL